MDPDSSRQSHRSRAEAKAKAGLLTRLRASLNPSRDEENIGFARVDHGREARKGFPEVVYGEGKSKEQIAAIAARILARSGRLLVTRVSADVYRFLLPDFPGLKYNAPARAIFHEGTSRLRNAHALRKGHVLVVCAGTSDIPVAEEAALTARLLGCRVRTLRDVGVAGLHRLLSRLPDLRRASVIIAVAGMEGALPSVVAGLVDKPVIGVPTSVGYGASMKGLAALLAILNSCASGLTVVNIDNGFGAGVAAARIAKSAQR
jgi:NCAIR mutase (PurE)-related protein